MRTKLVTSIVALLCVLAAGCSSGGSATATAPPPAPETVEAPPAPAPAPQPTATAEPEPTATPEPEPTATAEPTAAPEPSLSIPPVADDLVALPTQPAGVVFPTESWPEAELPEGVDAAALEELFDAAFDEENNPYAEIEAVVVISGGELVAERYGREFGADDVHVSWSVAKSVTHALLGILSAEGRVDVLEPAPVDEWSGADDPRMVITPDMLARMSSGLEWTEEADAVTMFLSVSSGAVEVAAAQQELRSLIAPPDERFEYSTGSTAVNGRIMGDIVGTGEAFEVWSDRALFAPLGISSVQLELDPTGNWIAGYGANMTARDFARFGLLYLRNGQWNGEAILPEGWVDYARTPSGTSDAYGSGFWLNFYGPNTFSAEGFQGQKVIMVPEKDLVVVVLATALNADPVGEFAGEVIDLFPEPS